MNKLEIMQAMFQMVKTMYAIMQTVDPGINHISMYEIGDSVDFRAYKDHPGDEKNETLFDWHLFGDGAISADGKMIIEGSGEE